MKSLFLTILWELYTHTKGDRRGGSIPCTSPPLITIKSWSVSSYLYLPSGVVFFFLSKFQTYVNSL